MPAGWFAAGLLLYVLGAAAGLVCWRRPADARRVAFGCATAGAALEIAASAATLFSGKVLAWTLPIGITVFPWTVRLDPLSAYFNLTLALLALAVSVFSAGYLREMETTRNLGIMGFFYNVLLLSLTLVFAAA